MTDHTNPDLEQRIAALEAFMKRDQDAVAAATRDIEASLQEEPALLSTTAPAPVSAIVNALRDLAAQSTTLGIAIGLLARIRVERPRRINGGWRVAKAWCVPDPCEGISIRHDQSTIAVFDDGKTARAVCRCLNRRAQA